MCKLKPSNDFHLINGDILFQDLACKGVCEAIESVTPGFNNAEVSHVGMYLMLRKKHYVIEAISPSVRLTPLEFFLSRAVDKHGRPSVFVGRLNIEYSNLNFSALVKAQSLIGIPYDKIYGSSEDAYYCSELVVDSYKYANQGNSFFPEHPMSFRNEATGEIEEYWKNYFSLLGANIPVGEVGSNPGKISLSKKLSIVHRYGSLTNWN